MRKKRGKEKKGAERGRKRKKEEERGRKRRKEEERGRKRQKEEERGRKREKDTNELKVDAFKMFDAWRVEVLSKVLRYL